MNTFVKDYNMIGACSVDVDLICKKWNHLFLVYRYEDTYKFIKFLRKDSELREIKVEISSKQAHEIIQKMKLIGTPHEMFKKAVTFRPA